MSNLDITVLHVDANGTFTELMKDYIHHHDNGITVRTAPNGDDALTVLEASDEIECVVSDYQLPGLNGLDYSELSEVGGLNFHLFCSRATGATDWS